MFDARSVRLRQYSAVLRLGTSEFPGFSSSLHYSADEITVIFVTALFNKPRQDMAPRKLSNNIHCVGDILGPEFVLQSQPTPCTRALLEKLILAQLVTKLQNLQKLVR